MIVDSLELAFIAFQQCRHGGRPNATLDTAASALNLVHRQGVIQVELPTPTETQHGRLPAARGVQRQLEDLTAEQLHLFELTREVVLELKDFCAADPRPESVRALGYAFHVLPEVVRTGDWMPDDFFHFNFRIAAGCWPKLSPRLREILCELAGITVWSADGLVKKRGFVIPWGRSGRPIPWSDVGIVDRWSDPDAN